MGYRKIIRAGATLEIERYQAYRPKGKTARAPKSEPTGEGQALRNENAAVRKLTWILNENFGPGDFHITLTYSGETPGEEEAKKCLRKYLKKLREIYRKNGQELRYVAVTEYSYARIHHHVIVNQTDQRLIYGAWRRGRPKYVMLDGSGSYWRLAAYLVKETRKSFGAGKKPGAKRWIGSRNLKHPEPVVKEVKSRFRRNPAEEFRYRGACYRLDPGRPSEYWVEATGWEHLIAYYKRI